MKPNFSAHTSPPSQETERSRKKRPSVKRSTLDRGVLDCKDKRLPTADHLPKSMYDAGLMRFTSRHSVGEIPFMSLKVL